MQKVTFKHCNRTIKLISIHNMNNVIRIDNDAHDKLREIKRSLKPEKKLLGEIASEIIKKADINGMSKAAKRRASRK